VHTAPGVGFFQSGYREFGLSREDAQDKDQRRLGVKEVLANPGVCGNWPLKRCVCVPVYYTMAFR